MTIVIGLAFFANGIGIGSALSRLPELRERLELTTSDFGMAMFGMGLGTAVSVGISARLCGRYGSKNIVRAGLVVLAAGAALVGLSFSLESMFVGLTTLGLGNGTLDVSMSSQELSQKTGRGRPRLPLLYGVYNVGGLIGSGTAAVAVLVGLPPSVHLLIVGFLLMIVAKLGLRSLVGGRPVAGRPVHGISSLSRGAVLMAVMILVLIIVQGFIPAWGGVYLISTMSAHSAFAGLGYAVYSGSMAVGRLSGDYLAATVGPKRVLTIGPLIAGVGMLTAAVAVSPLVALICYATIGIGLSCVGPLVYTVAGTHVGRSVSGGVATVATVGQAGEMIGPAVIGRAAEYVTLRNVFVGVGLVTLLMTVLARLAMLGFREQSRSTAVGAPS